MPTLAPGVTIFRPQFTYPYPCPHLPVTGQTTQYGGYDDDGFYQAGVAKAYTVLTLGQYAGTTAIVLNAKTENHSNNCVQDDVTCLMWSRYMSAANVGPANNGRLPWTTNGAGEGIFTYVAAANVAGLAGHSDWRIPNIFELFALCNMEVPNAVPDAVAFPGWLATFVWSSTTRPDNVTLGLVNRFDIGTPTGIVKTATWYAPLVRRGA